MQGVETSLLPGERILWDGRPLRHRVFRRTDVLLVPISVLWCGFAVFCESGALSSGVPLFAMLCVPLVLFGLYLVAGRFVVRVISPRRMRYTVTDRRVLVRCAWPGGRLITGYLNSLPPLVITEQPDGSGSLAFGRFPSIADVFWHRQGWRLWASEPSPPRSCGTFPTSVRSATSWPMPRRSPAAPTQPTSAANALYPDLVGSYRNDITALSAARQRANGTDPTSRCVMSASRHDRMPFWMRAGHHGRMSIERSVPSDDERAAGSREPGRWIVWRQDDNGNQFEVVRKNSRGEADDVAAAMQARGHKQTYWVAAAAG